jgi:hypothetical protein
LVLQFREHGRPVPHRIDLDGRSPAKVEAWILVELLHRQRDRDRFSKTLPFEIAGQMLGDAVDFTQEEHADALAELSRWHANAATLLQQVGGKGAAIVCSPCHFDLAVVLPVDGRRDALVRAGFVPGDERDPSPFFYVARSGVLQVPASGALPRIGRVATRDLVAMLLPAAEVGPGGKRALEFLRDAVADERRKQTH